MMNLGVKVMNRSSLPVGLSTLKKWKEDKGCLRFDLKYQRHQNMWSLPQKSMLVWSILADSYIPPLVFLKSADEMKDEKGKTISCYSVLDGLQRTSNLISFLNDEYRLHGSTPDVDIDGDTFEIGGMLFSEMPQELQNLINSYKFNIQVIANATEEEQTMLFTNINSGKELSTIQKAKPRLGISLCEYFAGVLEKDFFSQGLNMTASQALKEDDLAMALQSLMLMSDYDDYKSVSVAECLKFAEYLKTSFSEQEKQDFSDVTDYLGVFDKKAKYLRKNNVCCIVALAEQMMLEGVDACDYKSFLNDFFSGYNEEYKNFSGSGNVKRPNVEQRYRILKAEAYNYFGIQNPDNSENLQSEDSDCNPVDELYNETNAMQDDGFDESADGTGTETDIDEVIETGTETDTDIDGVAETDKESDTDIDGVAETDKETDTDIDGVAETDKESDTDMNEEVYISTE